MNLKLVLTLTASIIGFVYASTATPDALNFTPTSLADFKDFLQIKDGLSFEAIDKKLPNYREHTINALEHPFTYIRLGTLDFSKEEASKDEQHKMYELDLTVDEKDLLSKTALKELDKKLQDKVAEQYKQKVKLLRNVLERVPVIATLPSENGTEFQNMLRSHVEEFISNTLVYDAKRSSFSALHKALEGLASIYEVERKAQSAVTAILEKIDKAATNGVIKYNAIEFSVKQVKAEKPNESDNKEKPKPKVEKINLINVALKAAAKSTSSSTNLAFVLVFSVMICSILLAYKTYTLDSEKKPEEEESEAEEEN